MNDWWQPLPEAAAELGIAEATCRRLCEKGEIPAQQIGTRWRVWRDYVRQKREEMVRKTAALTAAEGRVINKMYSGPVVRSAYTDLRDVCLNSSSPAMRALAEAARPSPSLRS